MDEKIGHFYTETDRLITDQSVRLKNIIITPDAGTVADVTIYNGRDTNGESIGTFRTGSGITLPLLFEGGMLCDRGIYVDVGSNVTGVLIVWEYID